MSENIKMEDLQEVSTSEAEETTEVVDEQNPLKAELEKVHEKVGAKSELEKAAFSLRKNAERLAELGGDPKSILGIEKEVEADIDEDDAPVTIGMLKKLQKENATQTALQLADDIADPIERELVKHHVENSIRPSGNPREDLNLARAIVNAAKNQQIIEEVSRKSPAKSHTSSSGVPAKQERPVELTSEEMAFMRPPFNMTKEQILAIRNK